MINMVDLLLEEVEEDIKKENYFNRFLEDISIYNEDDNYQTNNNQQNNNQQQSNNQPNNQPKNSESIVTSIANRLKTIVSSCDTFLEKQTRKVSEALSTINQKVNSNKYVKLANDISLDAIEILKAPKTVLKAGEDFAFVGRYVDKWMGGILGGLREQCQSITRNAKKGVDIANKNNIEPTKKVTILQKILNGCNGIIRGLTEAIKSVGRGFSNIWNGIRQSIGGNSNNQ